MGAVHLDRLHRLGTFRAHDLAEIDPVVGELQRAIVELRARLVSARRRLAEAEGRADATADHAARVGALVIEAHERARRERLESEHAARLAAATATEAARSVLAAAHAEAATLRAAVAELRAPAPPAARVLDFTARTEGAEAGRPAPRDVEQIAAV